VVEWPDSRSTAVDIGILPTFLPVAGDSSLA
jgi:hypothetical protein